VFRVFLCTGHVHLVAISHLLATTTAMGSLVCLPCHKRSASAPPGFVARPTVRRCGEWTPPPFHPVSSPDPEPSSVPVCACSPPQIRLYWGDYWPSGGERSPRYVGGDSDAECDAVSVSALSSPTTCFARPVGLIGDDSDVVSVSAPSSSTSDTSCTSSSSCSPTSDMSTASCTDVFFTPSEYPECDSFV
jgi:hypothetical protein